MLAITAGKLNQTQTLIVITDSFPCVFTGSAEASQSYTLVSTVMSWWEAQRYCREHHTDLASVGNDAQHSAVVVGPWFSAGFILSLPVRSVSFCFTVFCFMAFILCFKIPACQSIMDHQRIQPIKYSANQLTNYSDIVNPSIPGCSGGSLRVDGPVQRLLGVV